MKTRSRNVRWEDLNMGEIQLQKLILHFAQANKAEGKSPKTVTWYTEMLTDFTRFLTSAGRVPVLSEFNITTVREFVIYEQGRGVSPYTVQGKVRALKAFASWLFNEGYTTDHLLLNPKLPKAPANLIEPLTGTEIDQLVKYENPLTALGCRNITMLVLLLDTGLRVSELCGLRSDNAHIEEGYLKVTGKGSRERFVPIGGLAQKVLWRYIIHFRPEPTVEADNFLFLTLDVNRSARMLSNCCCSTVMI
jgi:integrase/recombinase XerC